VSKRGFTLFETLLALMIFSVAIVALVEAVNQLGNTTLHMRREAAVQERLRSLLLENTRLPMPAPLPAGEEHIHDGDVTFTIQREPITGLSNRDGQTLQDLFSVRVTAEWREGAGIRQAVAETWVYPPLFRPQGN
jgi:prepilin-type N-terminal cleavage/methylation domain-containing protein